jgi:hypothetical protein
MANFAAAEADRVSVASAIARDLLPSSLHADLCGAACRDVAFEPPSKCPKVLSEMLRSCIEGTYSASRAVRPSGLLQQKPERCARAQDWGMPAYRAEPTSALRVRYHQRVNACVNGEVKRR